MRADFFVTLKFCWDALYFKRTAKTIFPKCQKMAMKCFKAVDCFESIQS